MFFSKFLPVALLAVAPTTMAGPPEAPNCSARVLLNSATEQDHGRSRIEIDIGDNTVYVGYYDTTDKFCEETLFQTSDPANLELYQPAGSANGDKPFTHPFVWIGKCDSDKKKFTGCSGRYITQDIIDGEELSRPVPGCEVRFNC